MGKIPLFHESDQEEEDQVGFQTNASYAKHYDEFRRKEVLGQLKNLEQEDESSSSDDETTDDEVVDAEFDKEFFRTLAYLKRRDPAKYEEKPAFFENVKPVEEVALEKRKKKEKPMTLKDYERKVMLEKGGIFEDEEELVARPRAESPSLVQQQEQLKDEIKRALSKIDTEDEDEDDAKGGLLKERSKTREETEREKADYLIWLADKKSKEPPSEEVKPLAPLKDFWSSKNLSKEDAFLKDYILNKRFVDNSGDMPTYDDIVATSEDEEELEKQEEYERQYNFRFEEPDSEFVKRYPRNVEESVRIERNKRKEQRQVLKERKQHEKEQQKRELEELKAIKLQEIKERIQKLKEIAATDNMAIKEEDLESDFDPDEHDRRMQRMFDEDYYGVDEGDQKPEFPDLDVELGIENYDREKEAIGGANAEPHCEDDDFVMDADYEETQSKIDQKKDLQDELLESTSGKKKKKGKKVSKFAEVLRKDKPIFDPEDEKTYGQYIDEYYKLDYEDMIGDTPCRFRYVETVPNDFGLSIEEILMANTRELNRWASVKKTVQIRPKYTELGEIEVYKRKAQNESLKKKILPSLFNEHDESEEDEEIKQNKVTKFEEQDKPDEASETKQEKDKKKKKKKKKTEQDKPTEVVEEEVVDDEPLDKKVKKKKAKQAVGEIEQPASAEFVEEEELAVTAKKSKKKNKLKTGEQQEVVEDAVPEAEDQTEAGQKRKFKHPETSPSQPKSKKKRFDKQHKNRAPEGAAANVSDSRLRAFGINPRKFHNKLKYGGKNNQDSQQNGPREQNNGQENPKKQFGNRNQKIKQKKGLKK